jgi:hypothetical protein
VVLISLSSCSFVSCAGDRAQASLRRWLRVIPAQFSILLLSQIAQIFVWIFVGFVAGGRPNVILELSN